MNEKNEIRDNRSIKKRPQSFCCQISYHARIEINTKAIINEKFIVASGTL